MSQSSDNSIDHTISLTQEPATLDDVVPSDSDTSADAWKGSENAATSTATSVSASVTADAVQVVTITKTVRRSYTDEGGRDVVKEETISQEFEPRKDSEDFVSDLVQMGWVPRGKVNPTSSVKKPPAKPSGK